MAANPVIPIKQGSAPDLENTSIAVGADGIVAAAFYPQASSAVAATIDTTVGVERDANGNLITKDALVGAVPLLAIARQATVTSEDDEVVTYDANGNISLQQRYNSTTHNAAELIEDETPTRDPTTQLISSVVRRLYDNAGTLRRTLTKTVSRDANGRITGTSTVVS